MSSFWIRRTQHTHACNPDTLKKRNHKTKKKRKNIPFIVVALLILLPPSRTSDSESRRRLFSPFPTTVRALHFYRGKGRHVLPSSTRVKLCHAIIGALDWVHLRNKNPYGVQYGDLNPWRMLEPMTSLLLYRYSRSTTTPSRQPVRAGWQAIQKSQDCPNWELLFPMRTSFSRLMTKRTVILWSWRGNRHGNV